MKNLKLSIVLVLLFSLALSMSACQAPKEATSGWVSVSGEVRPGPKTGRAVIALLSKARQASRAGELTLAESHLERALRIEPQNATLWLYMAKLRLYAGKSNEAINLAQKALALSSRNEVDSESSRISLRADSWRVIAHAHQKMGNLKKAHIFQDKVNALSL